MTTKAFSQLGVRSKNLTGVKIGIEEVIDQEITVLDYRVTESKFSRHGDCLHLQIEYKNELRVIFTGSGVLKEDIQKVDKADFPFTTRITKINFKTGKEWFLKFT